MKKFQGYQNPQPGLNPMKSVFHDVADTEERTYSVLIK